MLGVLSWGHFLQFLQFGFKISKLIRQEMHVYWIFLLIKRRVDMFVRVNGVRHEWQCVQNTRFVQVYVEFKTGFASLNKCTQLINSSYQHERTPWSQCEVTSHTRFHKWIKTPLIVYIISQSTSIYGRLLSQSHKNLLGS